MLVNSEFCRGSFWQVNHPDSDVIPRVQVELSHHPFGKVSLTFLGCELFDAAVSFDSVRALNAEG